MTKLRPTRREILAGTAVGMAAYGLSPLSRAFAQQFPSQTFDVVVPTREGGGADRNLRAVTGVWKKYLGDATFEASFFPGASGRVGYEVYMGKRDATPYNLLFGNMGPEVLNWVIEPPETFKFPGDYKYFAQVDVDPSILFVRADGPFQTIEDVVEEGKKRTLSVAVSRLAHPASLGALALGQATGAKFNLIPFSGGRNTIAAVVTGETDIGALPSGGVIQRGDVIKVVVMFDDQNPMASQTHDAPVVNAVFGTDLPPLVSSRAFALHSSTFDAYADNVATMTATLQQAFADPALKEAVLETGAPWETMHYGGEEACQTYVDNIIKLGNEFKPLLTGKA